MKTQAFLVYGSLLGLVANLLSGCASKSRPYESTKTTVVAIDGSQTITETVKRDSKLRASGYKIDLAGFSVDEQFQEGGDSSYKLNSEGAKATPESQALAAFQSGLSAANQFYGRAESPTADNTQLMKLLSAIREDLATVRTNTPPPIE